MTKRFIRNGANLSIFALCVGAALTLPIGPAQASTVLVDPDNPNGWVFSNLDNAPNTDATGQFVTGPAPAPLGTGSANLTVGNAASSEILYNTALDTNTTNFTTLTYSTYVTTSTSGSGAYPTLQFNLYSGGTYEGRMVFDPGLLGPSVDNVWQSWNAVTADAWYFSDSGNPGKLIFGDCTLSGPTYCSLSQAETDLSNLGIDTDQVLFKAGSGQSDFNGDVDDFTIAYAGTNTTYNFDPNPAPEPASLAIFGMALAGFGLIRRRRKAA